MNDRRVQAVLDGLHKHRGIRRPDLGHFVRDALTIWCIQRDEDHLLLRARLICHLTAALSTFGDHEVNVVGRAAYNIDRDPTMNNLNYLDRLRSLAGRASLRGRSLERMVADVIRPAVVLALNRPLVTPTAELEAEYAKEIQYASTLVRAGSAPALVCQAAPYQALRQSIRSLYRSPLSECIEGFVSNKVIVPRPAGAGFIVTRTERAGSWVCAFTSLDLLRAHAAAAATPWDGAWSAMSGAELIRRLQLLPAEVGVILDPPADTTSDVQQTLPLPATTIRTIVIRP